MNEYYRAVIFILIGLAGAIFHYLKKRYVDRTFCLGLKEYLLTNPAATANAIFAIIAAEISLSMSGTDSIHLAEFVGAITAGYTADSSLNKTS